MKASNHFKNTIQAYLEQRAKEDELFVPVFAKENKNIDDCITYILNTVQKSGCNGFADEEIYSMALHYYDEDEIEIGKSINGHVVVNHVVQLTDEEKEEARQKAIQKLQDEAYNKMKQPVKKTNKVQINPQPSLFDF
ncbi:PcfK-like family protein [Bacteroides sp. 224]|uniref:PcfK-like family protein n=1 Tax=Bacteroides sp. 224 TaxID=2302936 RepID=UPI0013D0E3B7|nr:PcfK-like family protein [Bacteroides sp. 224]NDV64695.1 PcfK-like protein [Bacteroides sp. 224]